MSSTKVAIVTGANKGIGFEIVKGLCQKFEGVVYLTARDVNRGKEAIKKIEQCNLNTNFHQLDVDDQESCDKFRDYLKEKYEGIDILVNNAAVYFNETNDIPFSVKAEAMIKTNYFGLLRVCNSLYGLLRPGARVVNISSSAGHLSRIPGEELRKRFAQPCLEIEDINELMNNFVKSAKNNTCNEDGWGESGYVVSKVGVSALTIIQQRIFETDHCRPDILVNCCHPGYVKTDMTDQEGEDLPEQGAKTPLFLALLPKGESKYKGAYVWNDKKIFDWFGPNPKKFYIKN